MVSCLPYNESKVLHSFFALKLKGLHFAFHGIAKRTMQADSKALMMVLAKGGCAPEKMEVYGV